MRISLALILLLTLTACGLFPTAEDKHDDSRTEAVETLYSDAMDEMKDNNYDKAVKAFEKLQSSYPYGRYAQQAQLEIAYAYYKQKEPESALAAADRFIKQYPNNPHVDYAYYLKGLINFNEDIGLFGGEHEDLSQRDPKAAHDAFDAFKDLATRFPDSKYADDARARMQYLINMLARYDIHVARYYLRRGAYIAAVNRAQDVLTGYPQTPSTRDALQIMVQAYDAMGMDKLRDDARRVLDKNVALDSANVRLPQKDQRPWWQFWQ